MGAGVVIVGGGQAGLEAAAALRSQGYTSKIQLVGDEPHLPYQRPPLSKDYLSGKTDADSLLLRGEIYYKHHNIDLIINSVTAIHRDMHEVGTASGRRIPYEKLILATGARNRAIPIRGAEHVLYLRTWDESDALRARVKEASRAVVIGGGFIGLEVAAAIRGQGKSVTVVEAGARLMARAVSPELSEFFLHLHQDHGVDVRLDATVREVRRDAVILGDGTSIASDLTVAGIGVIPNQELAEAAGLAVDNGIVTDELLRTGDPDIYAIGDCANYPSRFAVNPPGGRVRLESVQNAVDQARCTARGITGNPSPYSDVPWFWTDQFGVRFQMAGLSAGYDQAIWRGTVGSGKFSMFYFKDGRLIGVDSVNKFADHIAARKLLAAGTALRPEQAADESVDLKKL
jgi:3-phenylpropionate/trans-cinnamate dioxygenase ferredoxin reductase subunit